MKPFKDKEPKDPKARIAVQTEADQLDRAHTLRQIKALERIATALEAIADADPQGGAPALDALAARLKIARTKLATAIAANTPEE